MCLGGGAHILGVSVGVEKTQGLGVKRQKGRRRLKGNV